MNNICQECGMVVRTPTEYHPYAACLMFKACHDGDQVRANLEAVRSDARSNQATPDAAEAGKDAIPEGWKLVPNEPTEAMTAAGAEAQNRACYQKPQPVGSEWGSVYYRAMIAAAPAAPLGGGA